MRNSFITVILVVISILNELDYVNGVRIRAETTSSFLIGRGEPSDPKLHRGGTGYFIPFSERIDCETEFNPFPDKNAKSSACEGTNICHICYQAKENTVSCSQSNETSEGNNKLMNFNERYPGHSPKDNIQRLQDYIKLFEEVKNIVQSKQFVEVKPILPGEIGYSKAETEEEVKFRIQVSKMDVKKSNDGKKNLINGNQIAQGIRKPEILNLEGGQGQRKIDIEYSVYRTKAFKGSEGLEKSDIKKMLDLIQQHNSFFIKDDEEVKGYFKLPWANNGKKIMDQSGVVADEKPLRGQQFIDNKKIIKRHAKPDYDTRQALLQEYQTCANDFIFWKNSEKTRSSIKKEIEELEIKVKEEKEDAEATHKRNKPGYEKSWYIKPASQSKLNNKKLILERFEEINLYYTFQKLDLWTIDEETKSELKNVDSSLITFLENKIGLYKNEILRTERHHICLECAQDYMLNSTNFTAYNFNQNGDMIFSCCGTKNCHVDEKMEWRNKMGISLGAPHIGGACDNGISLDDIGNRLKWYPGNYALMQRYQEQQDKRREVQERQVEEAIEAARIQEEKLSSESSELSEEEVPEPLEITPQNSESNSIPSKSLNLISSTRTGIARKLNFDADSDVDSEHDIEAMTTDESSSDESEKNADVELRPPPRRSMVREFFLQRFNKNGDAPRQSS